MEDKSPLFKRSVALILAIPKGKVVTYGQVAELISAPGCARHVSYILSSSSKKYGLPWQRVISAGGKMPSHTRTFTQIKKLKKEGVEVEYSRVDLEEYQWKPTKKKIKELMKGLPKHRSIHSLKST